MKHALSKPQFELSFIIGKGRKKKIKRQIFNEIFRLFALPVEGGAATTVW
jgi:hypothetical protein